MQKVILLLARHWLFKKREGETIRLLLVKESVKVGGRGKRDKKNHIVASERVSLGNIVQNREKVFYPLFKALLVWLLENCNTENSA